MRILYFQPTGPLFQVYNCILRRFPQDMYQVFEAGENSFATTIHVLVSAVHKIARTMKIPNGLVLYAGLGGLMELPERFWHADARGCKGYVEWGFRSTTSDKAVALQYSGVQQGRPLAMVMEIVTASVDRGACIRDFSQVSPPFNRHHQPRPKCPVSSCVPCHRSTLPRWSTCGCRAATSSRPARSISR